VDVQVRDLIKQPLSAGELRALASRAEGGIRALVKPNNQKDIEGLSDAQVLRFLADNPNAVRRPIVDTGTRLTLGFRPDVRKALDEELG
jgi:arsenate reductase-like glutaredoxin family protein